MLLRPDVMARTESAERIVMSGLRPGEEILWSGRPATRWVFEPLDLWCLSCAIPAGIAWPFIMGPLFTEGFVPGIALWVLGLSLCFWPMIDRRLGRTVYVLTNQRAFIFWELFGRPYRERELNSSRVEVLRLRSNRPGTVAFLPRRDLDRADRAVLVMRHLSFDFMAVSDAMAVLSMTEAARARTSDAYSIHADIIAGDEATSTARELPLSPPRTDSPRAHHDLVSHPILGQAPSWEQPRVVQGAPKPVNGDEAEPPMWAQPADVAKLVPMAAAPPAQRSSRLVYGMFGHLLEPRVIVSHLIVWMWVALLGIMVPVHWVTLVIAGLGILTAVVNLIRWQRWRP